MISSWGFGFVDDESFLFCDVLRGEWGGLEGRVVFCFLVRKVEGWGGGGMVIPLICFVGRGRCRVGGI